MRHDVVVCRHCCWLSELLALVVASAGVERLVRSARLIASGQLLVGNDFCDVGFVRLRGIADCTPTPTNLILLVHPAADVLMNLRNAWNRILGGLINSRRFVVRWICVTRARSRVSLRSPLYDRVGTSSRCRRRCWTQQCGETCGWLRLLWLQLQLLLRWIDSERSERGNGQRRR